jgi:hypothetical protein
MNVPKYRTRTDGRISGKVATGELPGHRAKTIKDGGVHTARRYEVKCSPAPSGAAIIAGRSRQRRLDVIRSD